MFELEFMRLAAAAGVAAAVALAVLGVYVVLKRVVFVGLALANIATLGAAAALALALPVELTAIVTSLAGAAALALASTPRRIPAESLIGWGYAAAASLTVLVLAKSAVADSEGMRLLFGNVLAVTAREVWLLGAVAAAVVALHVVFAKRFVLVVFDPEAARAAGIATGGWTLLLYLSVGAATAAAVHETGALLAFALLTLPAMAALLVTRGLRAAFFTAAAIAVTCSLGGLVLSFTLDLPTGPFTVALLSAAVVIAAVMRRFPRLRRTS
ncbi:MAG: metal ABC transporter permease [Acidobacteriota bacterium]